MSLLSVIKRVLVGEGHPNHSDIFDTLRCKECQSEEAKRPRPLTPRDLTMAQPIPPIFVPPPVVDCGGGFGGCA